MPCGGKYGLKKKRSKSREVSEKKRGKDSGRTRIGTQLWEGQEDPKGEQFSEFSKYTQGEVIRKEDILQVVPVPLLRAWAACRDLTQFHHLVLQLGSVLLLFPILSCPWLHRIATENQSLLPATSRIWSFAIKMLNWTVY